MKLKLNFPLIGKSGKSKHERSSFRLLYHYQMPCLFKILTTVHPKGNSILHCKARRRFIIIINQIQCSSRNGDANQFLMIFLSVSTVYNNLYEQASLVGPLGYAINRSEIELHQLRMQKDKSETERERDSMCPKSHKQAFWKFGGAGDEGLLIM